jgi:hypothetical protein
LLERFVLGRLAGRALILVQEHLEICEDCRSRVAATEAFVNAFREVASSLAADALDFVHQTSDGPVRLTARRATTREWIAEITGEESQTARRFDRVEEANAFLVRVFAELFPEHRCTAACRPAGTRDA